jgi:hypothetical protein
VGLNPEANATSFASPRKKERKNGKRKKKNGKKRKSEQLGSKLREK